MIAAYRGGIVEEARARFVPCLVPNCGGIAVCGEYCYSCAAQMLDMAARDRIARRKLARKESERDGVEYLRSAKKAWGRIETAILSAALFVGLSVFYHAEWAEFLPWLQQRFAEVWGR